MEARNIGVPRPRWHSTSSEDEWPGWRQSTVTRRRRGNFLTRGVVTSRKTPEHTEWDESSEDSFHSAEETSSTTISLSERFGALPPPTDPDPSSTSSDDTTGGSRSDESRFAVRLYAADTRRVEETAEEQQQLRRIQRESWPWLQVPDEDLRTEIGLRQRGARVKIERCFLFAERTFLLTYKHLHTSDIAAFRLSYSKKARDDLVEAIREFQEGVALWKAVQELAFLSVETLSFLRCLFQTTQIAFDKLGTRIDSDPIKLYEPGSCFEPELDGCVFFRPMPGRDDQPAPPAFAPLRRPRRDNATSQAW